MSSLRPNGLAVQLRAQRLRGPTEAPEFQCQTLPEADWYALWLVNCNRLLGGMSSSTALWETEVAEASDLRLVEVFDNRMRWAGGVKQHLDHIALLQREYRFALVHRRPGPNQLALVLEGELHAATVT